MAFLDPNEAQRHLRERTLEAVRTHFPIKGRTYHVTLEHVEVPDRLHPDSVHDQHVAKTNERTWGEPVQATFALRSNAEPEKIIERKKFKIADLPRMTNRHSFIVEGQEWQVDNQWQLMPGVYVRRDRNNQVVAKVNAVGANSFDVLYTPEDRKLILGYGGSKALPLLPFLKALGASDHEIQKAWGPEVWKANQGVRGEKSAFEKFYKMSTKKTAPDADTARQHFLDMMAKSKLHPEQTEIALGQRFENVTGDVLLRASKKMMDVQAGAPEDDRDSLRFKTLRTVGDFMYDRVVAAKRDILSRAQRQLDRPEGKVDLREVFKGGLFSKPIIGTFKENQLSRVASQINPVEMLSGAFRTTLMGQGGIRSERMVVDEAKFVNPTHLGFLDPAITPEGGRTGIDLRLPLGVRSVKGVVVTPMFNIKSGKIEDVSVGKAATSNVVLSDQVTWKDGKPHPHQRMVQTSGVGGDIVPKPWKEADYVLPHASQMFGFTTNLIPYLNSNSGGRVSMAARHIEQSTSLLHREAPLVQVATGSSDPKVHTFEKLLGNFAAQTAPVAGEVTHINKNGVTLKTHDGKSHVVQLYHNYPLNDAKSVLTSTPVVKVGDKLKQGDLIADTNFTKGGQIALGSTFKVAYVPYRGLNFEDGVVISQSAADRFASEHLHKQDLQIQDTTVLSKKKFIAHHPGLYSKQQLDRLDDDGVIRVGLKVHQGDPLVAAMKPFEVKDRFGLSAISRALANQHIDNSLRWKSESVGEVVAVHRSSKGVNVHIRTVEPMTIGDKLSSRHGAKGIVSMILPDHEMPKTEDGSHAEVLLNPFGLPGRINPGQAFETAAGKIAQKTGKPYVIKNFSGGDALEKLQADLKAHGLHDKEELFDPLTGHSIGKALVGPQHLLKLVHQVEKKVSARSGMTLPGMSKREEYDLDLQPGSGGGLGGQSFGTLGLYALLAHGATATIREGQTWKSEGPDPQTNPAKKWPSQHLQVWSAIQRGEPLPVPTPTFAFQKFTDMLRASGINVEKNGSRFKLMPLTDKKILEMATDPSGRVRILTKPSETTEAHKTDNLGNPRPVKGGLYDESLTGGHGGGKWSVLKLPSPLPNPVFEAPIQRLLGLKATEFSDVVNGISGFDPKTKKLVPLGKGPTGGEAIKAGLDTIDVKKSLASVERELANTPLAKADKLVSQVKYLRALDQVGMSPTEAYILHHVPVLPPVMRPMRVMPSGDLKHADVVALYKKLGSVTTTVGQLFDTKVPEELLQAQGIRAGYYDSVKAITGIGTPIERAMEQKKPLGLMHQIGGTGPKASFFQDALINKRQDLSGRAVIVPEPALGLDEVGVPKDMALRIFTPFVVHELVRRGYNQGDSQTMISDVIRGKAKHPAVWSALEAAAADRPVLMKRDPALHKYSIQGFKPKLVSGQAIQIHPLVVGGFNADFDGDQMALYVPIHQHAVEEARRMMPSNNLFSDASGRIMYQPTLESAFGLYRLSRVGSETKHKFGSYTDTITALKDQKVSLNDVVSVGPERTTPGRVLLASVLPAPMQKNVLTDLKTELDKKGLSALLTHIGKEHKSDYGPVVNKLKDLGNETASGMVKLPVPSGGGVQFDFHEKDGRTAATLSKNSVFIPVGVHTLGLEDLAPDKTIRNAAIRQADPKIHEIDAMRISEAEKDRRKIEVWQKTTSDLVAAHLEDQRQQKNPDNLYMMFRSGAKPSMAQYQQLKLSPMLLKDSADRIIPTPVKNSYSEGLSLAEYWTQMHGARSGAVKKVQEVRDPGYMSKLLMNNMMHLMVTSPDCGTKHGIVLPVDAQDVHDRYLAKPFKSGKLEVPAGTLLTPPVLDQIKSADRGAQLVVRSPLQCEAGKGLCTHCLGLNSDGQHYSIGTNVGVLSAHAIGERSVQLTLKAFHEGGVASGGSKLLNAFGRFQQLMNLPKGPIPNEAVHAMVSGKVTAINTDQTGARIMIGDREHFVPKGPTGIYTHTPPPGVKDTGWAVKVGDEVKAGQRLSDPSRSYVNPHRLYEATKNIEDVRSHMTNEIADLYKDEGIRRRHIELLVRAMSDVAHVHDPGDAEGVLRGEHRSLAGLKRINAELRQAGKKPVTFAPVLKGVMTTPTEVQEDWMALLQHQRLRDTLLEAAATGGVSDLHSTHPIPGIAFGAEFGAGVEKGKPHY